MSVPTLTNMATAPAMPPPAAFAAAFERITDMGCFSAGCMQGGHGDAAASVLQQCQEPAWARALRTEGAMKTFLRVGP